MEFDTINLFDRGVRILPDGQLLTEDRRMQGGMEGWTVATFHVETGADVHSDTWEVHPAGDELVTVPTGSVRIYLKPENKSAPAESVHLTTGHAYIVPGGRRHRLELDQPSDLMSIGPRRGTRLERRTA